MLNIIQFINSTIGSDHFLLSITLGALFFKVYLLSALFKSSVGSTGSRKLVAFIGLVLLGLIFNDLSWIIGTVRRIFNIDSLIPLMAFAARLSWAFYVIQYQALSLFLSNLVEKKFRLRLSDKVFLLVSGLFSSYFFFIAFFRCNVLDISPSGWGMFYLPSESGVIQITKLYVIPLLIPPIIRALQKIKDSSSLPAILISQLKVFINYFIIPVVCLEVLNIKYITVLLPINKYALNSFIVFFSSLTLYYCCRRIIGLRFLNLKKHVESKETFDFIVDFKDILEQLSYVTSLKELSQITQTFFERAFAIPLGRVRLYLRQEGGIEDSKHNLYHDIVNMQEKVEKFLVHHEMPTDLVTTSLYQWKIFIKDEIEFTNFYEEAKQRGEIVAFLDSINADIFLPIYERKAISAYIIVERDARPARFYTSKERDEMLVFTSYLSNVINLLKYSNLDALQQREKEIQEELYAKHQEINHYKESIRSFLRSHKERKIGIVFYKARRFSYANEAAQELIGADINAEQGHPLAVALKNLCRKVQEYKTVQAAFAYDEQGNKVVATGIPSLEHNAVIIMLYYPEVSDIMRAQFELLKDPSKWDYILYLETTSSGQLINQLVPGSGEKLLNFKIAMLEVSLSKKATLLEMAEGDIMPTVEILHHISMRQQLHVLKLHSQEKNHDIAIKLFGLNPLLGATEEGLLSKLDNGTLFIENIHFLSLETQQALADFIVYGHFHKFRSDHKVVSNVRIICSSSKNIATLVAEGQFSKALFQELKKASLVMPSLALLPDTEVTDLAEGFSHQALKTETFKNLIQLSDKDKDRLLDQRPVSLQELKEKVHQLLVSKSTKHKLYETTEFDPAYHVTDPELVQAVRMGKKALKDPHIMTMLWNKFKNQNKIAILLGVNRSSVNRRCQEYNLGQESESIH